MSDVELRFTREEYGARIERTRQSMVEKGLELIIVSDPSNMAWLTGYDGWSFYVHQGVLVGLEGEPIWWGRAMDAQGARRTVFMQPDNIVGYDDTYVQNPLKHPMEQLSQVITSRGWAKARIGVEMDNYWFSAAASETLRSHLKEARFSDATGLVNWQRKVKSSREVEFIRRAAAIVDAMHAKVIELVEPGLPKNVLVAEIQKQAILGAGGHWGDYCAIVPMLPSGIDATAPHLTWDDRPFKNNEGTFFELGGCYKRYHAPLSRTVYLGKPPQKFLDAERAVSEATEAGLAKCKPGVTCGEVAEAFFGTLQKRGFHKDSRAGYSIGLSYPPDWGERTLSIRRGDKTVLEPNMTLHFMPALWLDDGGLELSETILITDTGVECLSKTPRKLVVKG
ncbi:ectoine hydrolase DoeA [Aestuariivirga litoralis]|uniref:Ectoine hydrolase DoeA n=1 Tax=Aestuariivirga litoralis TaxID=2650924 RepID=A0A2W2AZV9_9HYPH|nr:ectoine hydrolase DoeA [Aestuariivirga litoralis]PZF78150.1 ectoine hydrolase DoeA [Aestuariivirga litoralis]